MIRKKVLFVAPSMGFGGSERVLLHLLRSISRDACEPHLALLSAEGQLLTEVPADIRIHDLGAKRARYAAIPFARLCWKLKPNVVLSLSAHLNSAVIAARPLLPEGVQLFTREGTRISAPEVKTKRWRLWLYGWLYRRADVVICQSKAMRAQLIRDFRLQPEKTMHLYNPVDINLVSKMADRESNPLPQSRRNIVAVGRLSAAKGFDLLLEAMAAIHQAAPDVKLTIVGDGPLYSELQAQAKKLALESCVHFAGYRSNPYPYLKYADAVVVSSRYEALPNVVLEAISLRTPVVSTNCSDALLEISETTSLLKVVEGDSAESIARAVLEALSEVRNTPVVETAFVERFGLENAVGEYERLLQKDPHQQAEAVLLQGTCRTGLDRNA